MGVISQQSCQWWHHLHSQWIMTIPNILESTIVRLFSSFLGMSQPCLSTLEGILQYQKISHDIVYYGILKYPIIFYNVYIYIYYRYYISYMTYYKYIYICILHHRFSTSGCRSPRALLWGTPARLFEAHRLPGKRRTWISLRVFTNHSGEIPSGKLT